jgi:hypothetical protein
MDLQPTRELLKLSDTMAQLNSAGALTTENQDALAQRALSVVDVSNLEVSHAVGKYMQTGDRRDIDALKLKAAKKAGMPDASKVDAIMNLGGLPTL